MVWPTLISVAEVPGPYLGWAITDVETSESVTSAPSATSRIAFPPLLYGESLGLAVQWREARISQVKLLGSRNSSCASSVPEATMDERHWSGTLPAKSRHEIRLAYPRHVALA